MTGRAYTLLYQVRGNPPGTVGDYIDDVPPGSVLVLDNGGRESGTVWGDILTEVAHRRGVAGTVIDGLCRDVALCLELGYPVFTKDHWMRTGKDRVQLDATNVPVIDRRRARAARRHPARRRRRRGRDPEGVRGPGARLRPRRSRWSRTASAKRRAAGCG